MEFDTCFSDLLPAERERLREKAQMLSFPPGDEVITQGELVEDLMILSSGQVRVTQTQGGEQLVEFAGPLGPGEVLGEMSFVDGEPASATLVADGEVEVLALARTAIDAMTDADPAFAGRFYRSLFLDLARRLRSANKRLLAQQSQT